jgi:branched-chain amino acid transport system substrate-binding protein
VNITRRSLLGSAALGTATAAMPLAGARAQGKPVIKIGVLNDQSGPYHDTGGETSVVCTQQAADEFASQTNGYTVQVVSADHQNKPDLGAQIARQWFDQGVDMIIDVPNSGVALAVAGVAKEKNKILISSGAATSDLTGSACSANIVHWTYDTWMLAQSTGGAMVKAGGDSWYFITADYAFGKKLESDTTALVKAAHGTVKGSSPYPFPGTSDFSSFLVQAQNSGAKVLGLANAGGDTINSIKQAREFGIKMNIAALLMFITDVNALGLDVAQGLHLTESFYWNLNDRTRAFTKRILPKTPNNYPNMTHAGCYAGTLHYLKAINQIGAAAAKADGKAAVAAMKALPTEDDCFGRGSIRADGRGMFNAYLFQVKNPSESRGKWDYYNLVQASPPEKAWRPLADGGCSLVKT